MKEFSLHLYSWKCPVISKGNDFAARVECVNAHMHACACVAGIGSGLHTQNNLIFLIRLESGPEVSEEKKI